MHMSAPDREQLAHARDRPDQVHHHAVPPRLARAQRQARHRPQVVLELARHRPLDRPVPRVVHPRGHLVRQQSRPRAMRPPEIKELNRQHTHVPKPLHDRPRVPLRQALQLRRHARRRRDRGAQNPARVMVLHQRIRSKRAVAPAHRHDRELTLKRHHRLYQARHPRPVRPLPMRRDPVPVGLKRAIGTDHPLPLAVIPHAPRLEHRRQSDPRERRTQLRRRGDRRIRMHTKPQRREECLLLEPVLRRLQRARNRMDRRQRRQRPHARRRHVLKLQRRGIEPLGKPCQRRPIAKGRTHMLAKRRAARLRIRIQKAQRHPQRPARQRQHPPQLSAAKHADLQAKPHSRSTAAKHRASARRHFP